MKKFLAKTLYLGIVFYIAALAGCEVPLEPKKEAPVPQGMGRVLVNIGGGPERTILPAETEFDKITNYTLSFSGGPRAVEDLDLESGGGIIDLPAGSWTITATGWGEIGDTELNIAEGSVELTVESEEVTEATILLAPIPNGGDGTFSYSLTINDRVYQYEFTINPAEGEPIPIALESFSGNGPFQRDSVMPLPPGEYTARLRFWRSGKYMGLTEVFHIYSGLTTEIAKALNPNDYFTTITDFDLTDRITPPMTWETPVTAFERGEHSQYFTVGGYTTAVSWSPAGSVFTANTEYTATVALQEDLDWTFEGIPANSFTYNGASVANSANSGVVVVTFPATDNRVVTDVTVMPASPTVFLGANQQFSAVVTGESTPPQTVSWSVSGSISAGTTITQTGLLTVALDESAASLTVTATPDADPTKHGDTTVTVSAAAEVIEIHTAEDLQKIGGAYLLDGKYKLMQNLTLSDWTPIGSSTAPFSGDFDGNNKTITVESFNSSTITPKGIFGFVAGVSTETMAVVKNLDIVASTVAHTSTTAPGAASGLLAAYARYAEISGITLSGSFSHTGSTYVAVGGIVGYFRSGILRDCSGSLNVSGTSTAGSSAATLYTGGPSVSNPCAGGFVGQVGNMGAGSGPLDIINCSNTGNVTVTAIRNTYGGGIVGYFYNSGSIEGCSSTGNINALKTSTGNYGGAAGGIAGYSNVPITKCYAKGTVTGDGLRTVVAGGIVGYNYASVTQSYFSGTVNVTGTSIVAGYGYAGGIAGSSTTDDSQITDCWSHGEVNGRLNAGGIIGANNISQSPNYVLRCYSTAVVNGVDTATTVNNSNGIGGIAGTNRTSPIIGIANCVALNPTVSSAGAETHRILGYKPSGSVNNNYAWSDMDITRTNGTYTADKGDGNNLDGADVASEALIKTFYEGLDWDFTEGTGVWAMDAYGYPKLQWQAEEITRTPLGTSGI